MCKNKKLILIIYHVRGDFTKYFFSESEFLGFPYCLINKVSRESKVERYEFEY